MIESELWHQTIQQ